MNWYTFTITGLFLISCFAMTTCSNNAQIQTSSSQISSEADSVPVEKGQLTKIYEDAIAEFIKAVDKKDKISFDTLFFGKHVYGQPDDFPDIDLPATIENTQVRLISPEAGIKKQRERKSLVYVNMMGWVDKENADFMFVVFSNGAQHQFDYFINFIFNTTRKEFELGEIAFENYLHSDGQKPKRITVYKDGKYIFD